MLLNWHDCHLQHIIYHVGVHRHYRENVFTIVIFIFSKVCSETVIWRCSVEDVFLETVIWRCSVEKVFVEISQNLQKHFYRTPPVASINIESTLYQIFQYSEHPFVMGLQILP